VAISVRYIMKRLQKYHRDSGGRGYVGKCFERLKKCLACYCCSNRAKERYTTTDGTKIQIEKQLPPGICARILPESVRSVLGQMMDFSLLWSSYRFAVFVAGNMLSMLGFFIPYVYVTQFAVSSLRDSSTGAFVSKDVATLLISTIGLTNTLGRLLFGLLGDQVVQKRRFLCCTMSVLDLSNYCLLIAGFSVVALPFCATYYQALLCCAAFGLFVGE